MRKFKGLRTYGNSNNDSSADPDIPVHGDPIVGVENICTNGAGSTPIPEPQEGTFDPFQFASDQKAEAKPPTIPIMYYYNAARDIHEYTVPFYGPIMNIFDYQKLIDLLMVAPKNTEVTLQINSGGGSVSIARLIASTFAKTNATVIADCVGKACSAAMFLWSAAHKQIARPRSVFMFHMSLHQDGGNSNMIKQRAERIIDMIITYLLGVSIKKGHLLQSELDTILEHNKNIWVSGTTMMERLEAHDV